MRTYVETEQIKGRRCGDCSLCCKLFEIEELNKPKDKWCQHCRPAKGGCSIYEQRPQACAEFICSWLSGWFDEEWFPLKSKIVVRLIRSHEINQLKFYVDPEYPNRWREEPYYSGIKNAAFIGLTLGGGPSADGFATQVVGRTTFFIFPTRDIERTDDDTPERTKAVGDEFDLAIAELLEIVKKSKPRPNEG